MLVGIYIGQFCITTLTWFFLTWFPVYLSRARHISIVKVGFLAALPALCGCFGGILGGVVSDRLLRATGSPHLCPQGPHRAGMALAMTMVACNYVNTRAAVVALMALAFFGKGFGALGWTVISDTSPRSSSASTAASSTSSETSPALPPPSSLAISSRAPAPSTTSSSLSA